MSLQQKSIWIVFTGKTDIAWLKILKPNFRHCYALLHDGRYWVSIDPLASHTDIEVHHQLAAHYDLPGWLEYQGHKVLKIDQTFSCQKSASFPFFSCVEVVKRLMGLHHPFIITPWQLYKFLQKQLDNKPNNKKEKEYG